MSDKSVLGHATITPTAVEVGSSPLLRLTYTVGARGIAPGGRVQIRFPRGSWTPVVMAEIPLHKYLQVANSEVALESHNPMATLEPRVWLRGVLESYVDIRVAGSRLQPDDQIVFTYGVRARGAPPVRCQNYALPRAPFSVLVDPDGSGELHSLSDSPAVEVRAAAPAQFEVIAPSVVSVGEPVALRVRTFDAFRNDPSSPYVGGVKFASHDDRAVLPGPLRIRPDDGNRSTAEARFTAPGVKTVLLRAQPCDELLSAAHTRPMSMGMASPEARPIDSVVCDAGPIYGARARVSSVVDLAEFATRSNPIRCVGGEPPYRIFWGDLHCHSTLSDGALPIEELYAWGRDIAALDIVAGSDHEAVFHPEKWETAQRTANEFYAPGEFVTFRAFEWTANNHGHRNVYYRSSEPTPPLPVIERARLQYTMPQTEFYPLVEDPEALIIPHHTLVSMNWEHTDPRERLVEIYSTWGRSEFSGNPLWDKPDDPRGGAQQGLACGYRLGFTAGSDGHDSRPGRCYPGGLARNLNFRGGLMAVLSPALTREAIFDVLWARRCYATTGERMLVEFTADGHQMGEEYDTASPIRLEARVTGTDRVALLEIVKDNSVLHAHRGTNETETLHWIDTQLPPPGESSFYYLRATQADGNLAWSSPIWVTRAADP